MIVIIDGRVAAQLTTPAVSRQPPRPGLARLTSAVGSLCVLDASRETGQAPPLMEEGGMDEPSGQAYETYDIKRLLALLPHRYPFLLVDRIVEARGDEYGVGIKNVTINEPQFLGHFPESPVMPGVLLIEAMAQTAGALCVASQFGQRQAQRRLYDDHRQGEVPQARGARRPGASSHDPHRQEAQHLVVPRRGEGRRGSLLRSRDFGHAGGEMKVEIRFIRAPCSKTAPSWRRR